MEKIDLDKVGLVGLSLSKSAQFRRGAACPRLHLRHLLRLIPVMILKPEPVPRPRKDRCSGSTTFQTGPSALLPA